MNWHISLFRLWRIGWEVVPTLKKVLLHGVVPIDHEDGLQDCGRFPDEANLRVAPRCEARSTTEVLATDIHPADEPDRAVNDRNLSGHDAEEGILRTFKEAGGEVVGSVRLPLVNPDFSAFVQRAKDLNPDGIFVFVPGGAQPPALAKAMWERGLNPKNIKLMGQGEIADETALRNMGEAALGIITGFHYDFNHTSQKNKDFVKAYFEDYKRNPNFFATHGYDGMHLIYETLKKTGGKADGESLVNAAKGMSWESPRGPMTIDPETRDVIQTVYIRRVERVGNELVNVELERFENVKDPVKERMKKEKK